jgi:hypothetical protein
VNSRAASGTPAPTACSWARARMSQALLEIETLKIQKRCSQLSTNHRTRPFLSW